MHRCCMPTSSLDVDIASSLFPKAPECGRHRLAIGSQPGRRTRCGVPTLGPPLFFARARRFAEFESDFGPLHKAQTCACDSPPLSLPNHHHGRQLKPAAVATDARAAFVAWPMRPRGVSSLVCLWAAFADDSTRATRTDRYREHMQVRDATRCPSSSPPLMPLSSSCSLGVWLARRLTALIDRSSQTLKRMTTKIEWMRRKTMDRD